MATSSKNIRSISLPSSLNPSNTSSFDSELQKLKSCYYVSESLPISSKTIQSALLGLHQLYFFVQQHIISQNSLVFQQHDQDGFVDLIDSCSNIRELFQMMKENVQFLQSALRRKGLACNSIQDDIKSYFSFRKKINKCVAKSLKTLKILENKNVSNSISILRETTQVSIAIFKDMLMFLTSPTMAKSGGWNFISKLMLAKSEANCHGEIGRLDIAFSSASGSKFIDGLMLKQSLKDVDVCIGEIEERLESLYRQMIRSRVAVLNILTNH